MAISLTAALISLPSSATQDRAPKPEETPEWLPFGPYSLLISTEELPIEECKQTCRAPGKCVKHLVTAKGFRCTYACKADSWCPAGSICRCSDARECAAPIPPFRWVPPALQGSCGTLERAREFVERSRRHRTRLRSHIESPPPKRISLPNPDECPHGFDARYGVCVLPCQEDLDCPPGMYCSMAQCINDCSGRICPEGYECTGSIALSSGSFGLPYCYNRSFPR